MCFLIIIIHKPIMHVNKLLIDLWYSGLKAPLRIQHIIDSSHAIWWTTVSVSAFHQRVAASNASMDNLASWATLLSSVEILAAYAHNLDALPRACFSLPKDTLNACNDEILIGKVLSFPDWGVGNNASDDTADRSAEKRGMCN